MSRKIIPKIQGIVVAILVIFLIFSILVPPATAVHVYPGAIQGSSSVTTGNTITFKNINLTIRGEEKIPVTELNFSIHNNNNDNVVAYVSFSVDGTETAENPSGKFTVTNTTTVQSDWYDYGYGYGYDEPNGPGYYFGYGYGYGYGEESGYSDITFLYDIVYTTHTTGTFYWNFSVNSTSVENSHTYYNSSSGTFTVSSSGGGGGAPIPNTVPTADAGGPYSGVIGEPVTFDGSDSTDSDGTIAGYRWDFANDGTWDTEWSTSSTATHTYNSEGDYIVKLEVKDDDGATDSDTASVSISSEPEEEDTDGDGISDDVDTDDDNDGIDDETETEWGSDSKNGTDVITIEIDGDTYYLIDTSKDGKIDTVRNETGEFVGVTIEGDEVFIDTDGDGTTDYVYDMSSGNIVEYGKETRKSDSFPPLFALLAIIVAVIVVIVTLFKTGYLYIDKQKPGKRK